MKYSSIFLLVFTVIVINCGRDGIDTFPPSISIVSHVSGQSIDDTTIIIVSTKDKSGISSVEFIINDSLEFTDKNAPYEYYWDTNPFYNGSEHTIKAISYDKEDNSNQSETIWLIIDKRETLWGRDYSITTTYLTLPDSGLSGIIPPEIGKFENLVYLDLKGNELAGQIPPEIENLKNLVYLDLSNNYLTGEIPIGLRSLTNLGIIKFSDNLLYGVLTDSICNFAQGTVFQINNNKFCPPYPQCISLIGSQDTTECN
mgnify:CR=1 FL=1